MKKSLAYAIGAWAIAGVLCVASASDENIGYGPFLVSSQSPGQSLRLGLIPRQPSSLLSGDWETSVSDTWTNTWVNYHHVQLDFERMNIEARIGYGVNHRCEMEFAAICQTTFGGWLDAPVQNFHRAFHMGQNGRDQVPRGRTFVHIDPSSSQPGLDLTTDDLTGPIYFGRFSTWYTVMDGGGPLPTVAATFALQMPLRRYEAYSGGYLDVAEGVSVAKRWERLFMYGVANYTRFGPDRIYGIRLYRGGFSGLLAIEGELLHNVHPIAQYLVSQGIARDYYDFSKASHEVAIGCKAHVDGRTVIEAAFLENVFVFDNSADFGIHLGISSRW